MDNHELRALQLKELEMLKDFATFCDENKIEYMLNSGTMLGAVRHKGFIPWDDDVDISMDLRNYKKFLALAPKGLPKQYFVQNYRTDHNVSVRWTRVRINGTTSMEHNGQNLGIHQGVCMDVFLMSGLSDIKWIRKVQVRAHTLLSIFLEKHIANIGFVTVSEKEKKIANMLPEFLRIPVCELLEMIAYAELDTGKYCFNTWESNPLHKLFPAELFKKRQLITFEDTKLWAPKDAVKYLEIAYGNWKELPPEDKRYGHADIIVDLEHDYSEYCDK